MRRRRWITSVASVAVALTVAPASAGSHEPVTGWVPSIPVSQQSQQFLTAMPDGTAFALDVGGAAITLWHSANYGVGWDALTYLPAVSSFAQARFGSPKVGFLADLSRLYITSDGATSPDWRQLNGPRLPKGNSFGAFALGVTGRTVAFGGDEYAPLHVGCNTAIAERVWTSHNNGRDWIAATLPPESMVSDVRYLDDRTGVALAYEMKPDGNPCEFIGDHNFVFVTHDGGAHFSKVHTCAVKSGEICTSASFLDAQHVLVGRNDGSMAMSSDGGRTFHEQPALPTVLGPQPTHGALDDAFWIQGFSAIGSTVFATTKLAGNYLSHDGGRTWVRESTCDSAYSLGVGEVAAFDAVRAIAGGPTCVATRLSTGTPAAGGTVPHSAAGVDWVGSTAGLLLEKRAGAVTLRRSSSG